VSDDNKATLQRFYDEVANAGNLDLIDELLSEDFVEHEEFPGIPPTREGVRQFFAMLQAAFPDGTFTTEDLIAEGDRVAARARFRGTHQGEWMGLPATGRTVDVGLVDIVQFRDGVGTAHWGVFDAMEMMQQLGAIPGPS
jgi:steroid delta-isomerase-like uncharacterized protein